MKNKLVFRILGALASALVIASVFIPFISVASYSQSLWQANEITNSIYLPIMIIVFGVLGVLVFSINKKTEFAYASSGALIFYLIMQTIGIIEQDAFGSLGVGYYCLSSGTLVMLIMTFICSLRSKNIEPVEITKTENPIPQVSMLDQIDKLYDDNTQNQSLGGLQNDQLNNVIQPLDSSLVAPIAPLAQESSVTIPTIPEGALQPIVSTNEPLKNEVVIPELAPSIPSMGSDMPAAPQPLTQPAVPQPVVPESKVELQPIGTTQQIEEQKNPVIAEFGSASSEANKNDSSVAVPVVTEASTPAQSTSVSNPVVAEFSTGTQVSSNPVLAEFGGVAPMPEIPIESEASNLVIEPLQSIQPIGSDKKVDVMADPSTSSSNNTSNLDIFG